MKIEYLLSADWGKDADKRRCCIVNMRQRSFQILDDHELTFEKLLKIGRKYGKSGHTLLSLDLAIGVPSTFLKLANNSLATKGLNFLDWLKSKELESDFWCETRLPAEWSPDRPFISVPKGKGALRRFHHRAGHDLKRRSDQMFGGKSPFIVSGIPGTVGSGTREFWRELHPHLQDHRDFGLWPFDGEFNSLFKSFRLVVAENYPAVSYTSVFAEVLPSPQLMLSKTHENVREAAINELRNLKWIKEAKILLPDLDICIRSEDEFDALLAALSQYRLLANGFGLVSEELSDSIAEGGILGSNAIRPSEKKSLDAILGVKSLTGRSKRSLANSIPFRCPIEGCAHVFKQSRNGWRDHVGSVKRHPAWHPDVMDTKIRQSLFEQEFAEFFQ